MALLNFISHNTKIDFVGMRKVSFAIVITTTLIFMGSLLFKGLNYGVDFNGGIIIEARADKPVDPSLLREKLESLHLGDFVLQHFGSNNDIVLKVMRPEEGEAAIQLVKNIKEHLGDGLTYRKIETVGPKVGSELIQGGIKAIAFALLGILIYIAFRFEWRFALCGIIALGHDCFLVLGLFSLFPSLEFNETAITAILITASYSINDTIVVFDRIRDNIMQFRKLSLPDILNKSINETLSRTILTVVTTFLATLALYLFGGPVIANFVLPILIALILGTLSSIFVASPLLMLFNVRYGKALDDYEDQIRKEKEEIHPRFQEIKE